MIQPFEQGSQVDMGRQIGRQLVAKWVAEGRAAVSAGKYNTLWNSVQQAAYNARMEELQAKMQLYTGDPAVARWAGEGAPTCGATWADAARLCYECGEEIHGDDHQDDDGHYYHEDCCPGCIAEFYVDPDSVTF